MKLFLQKSYTSDEHADCGVSVYNNNTHFLKSDWLSQITEMLFL